MILQITKIQLSGQKKKIPEPFSLFSLKSVKYGGKSDIVFSIFDTHIAALNYDCKL